MLNVKKILFLGFSALVLCSVSCKKEEDEDGPEIVFNSPAENQTFNVMQYALVDATVTDNQKLNTISVSLVDANQGYAHVAVPVSVTGKETHVHFNYDLDNIHLLTGYYYIRISANDGKHITNKYRKIYLIAVPKVLKGIYLVSNTTSATTNWSKIDTNFTSITPYHTFTGDYVGSGVTSYYQQGYNCGNYTGDFSARVLEFNTPKYSVSCISGFNPYFTGLLCDETYSYVAQYDGTIKGRGYTGNVVYNASALSGYYAKKMCFNSDQIVSEQIEKVGGAHKLVTYLPTGTSQMTTAISQDVVQFCEMDADNVFVFGNLAGQGTIQLYDRVNNNLWSPYPFTLAPGALLSAIKVDNDTYLLGHSNGTIYKYQFSISSVTSFLPGYTAVQLKYDDTHNELYVVEANKVTTINMGTTGVVHTINSSENILDLHLLYNR